MNSSDEKFGAINLLEQRFDVTRWRCGDIDLWPLFRFRLYIDAMSRTFQNAPRRGLRERVAQLGNRAARALWRVPLAAWRDNGNNAAIVPNTTAVFFSDGMSFTRLGDAWFDRVMDPLIIGLERRGHRSLKLTPLAEAHVPRHLPSRFVQPAIDRIKLTASPSRVVVDLPEFDALHRAAVEKFGDCLPSYDWLRLQAARMTKLAAYFEAILRETGARHAFVNTYYSIEGQSFVVAARRVGGRSIDVQHGIQGPQHIAYGRWSAVPARGYSTVPDEFWVWGADEAATIEAWRNGCATHVPRMTGNYWQQRWRDDGDPWVQHYLEQARALRDVRPEVAHVLVCLTSGVPESETIKQIEAAKLCGESIRWWWRLHPQHAHQSAEFADTIARQGLDASQVEQATHLPFYALLRVADLTVAHSSTTLREAAEFGVSSVVTSNYGVELHADLVERGMVVPATEPRSIADAVLSLLARKQRGGSAVERSHDLLADVLDGDFGAAAA
jgi:hypothetical protein